MKSHTLHAIAALGLLVCGGRSSIAQPLSLTPPIIIQVAEIDRYNVIAFPGTKIMDGAELGFAVQGMKQPEIDALVKDGVTLQRSVWVMDGHKIIAECKLVGEFRVSNDNAETEYGFLLGFDSVEKADKVSGILSLRPSFDELIRSRKVGLDDIRFWM